MCGGTCLFTAKKIWLQNGYELEKNYEYLKMSGNRNGPFVFSVVCPWKTNIDVIEERRGDVFIMKS
jgi:hypothetical protein